MHLLIWIIIGYLLFEGIVYINISVFILQIILGSSSVARRKILADMGYEFTVMVLLLFSHIYICR